jgi:hypothetical protein
MITKDMDLKITEHTKHRKLEKRGRSVCVQFLRGDKVFGELVDHKPNILVVRDWSDGFVKEFHRATIRRFLLLIDGGKLND